MTPTSALQMRFKIVSIFDVSQTDGSPLPELAATLTGDVARYELFMDALRAVSPLPIVFEPMTDKDGYCRFGEKIGIREGMSQIQTVSAVVHELTHAQLDDRTLGVDNTEPTDRRTQEVIAESCAFSTLAYYGINTGANSFGYVSTWSRNRDIKELKASLDVIRKTTAELIDAIDAKYYELAKERGIDLSIVTDELGAEANYNMIDGVINNEPPKTEETLESPTVPDIIATYTRNAEVRDPHQVRETVLMTLLFEDGNLNRENKRSRVKVEPPIGKYEIFSRDEGTPPHQTNYSYLH
jgi:hypothetical protein